MAAGFHITCVNKHTNGRIVRVGGEGWSMSVHDAILQLASGRIRLVILLENRYLDVGVRGESSDAYLVIETDGKPLHDIDQLPSC